MSTADRQSILNEIKVLSMLNHPNVIEYYENFLQDKAMVTKEIVKVSPGSKRIIPKLNAGPVGDYT